MNVWPFASNRSEVRKRVEQEIERSRGEVRQVRQHIQSSTRGVMDAMSGMVKITRESQSGKAKQ